MKGSDVEDLLENERPLQTALLKIRIDFVSKCILSYFSIFAASEPEVVGSDVDHLLENERANFKQLYEAVSQLGSVPMMIRAADMSATIPDEKVWKNERFVGNAPYHFST